LYSCGIDIGSKMIKVILLDDRKTVAKSNVLSGFDQNASVESALNTAMQQISITKSEITNIAATGVARKVIYLQPPINANIETAEVLADIKGAIDIHPAARVVVDVGAEEGKAVRCDEKGKVIDFVSNERCAAGAGVFIEAMSRALEIDVQDFGAMALQSKQSIPMNSQCTVFAESEVISLLHSNITKEDIARSVNDAIAGRVASMTRRIGIENDVVLVGGMAKNVGYVDAMKRILETDVIVLPEPEFIGAFGAALTAAEYSQK